MVDTRYCIQYDTVNNLLLLINQQWSHTTRVLQNWWPEEKKTNFWHFDEVFMRISVKVRHLFAFSGRTKAFSMLQRFEIRNQSLVTPSWNFALITSTGVINTLNLWDREVASFCPFFFFSWKQSSFRWVGSFSRLFFSSLTWDCHHGFSLSWHLSYHTPQKEYIIAVYTHLVISLDQ